VRSQHGFSILTRKPTNTFALLTITTVTYDRRLTYLASNPGAGLFGLELADSSPVAQHVRGWSMAKPTFRYGLKSSHREED